MNKFSNSMNQVLIGTILSLSTTVICAEVSSRGIEPGSAAKQNVIPAQGVLPDRSSKNIEPVWGLHAEQWELARSGETILSLPVLNQLVTAWLAEKQKIIEIQYPGGEDGELWVQELTDWLVSLGIPSKFMVTTPGSGADDVIKFKLIK